MPFREVCDISRRLLCGLLLMFTYQGRVGVKRHFFMLSVYAMKDERNGSPAKYATMVFFQTLWVIYNRVVVN